MTRKDYVLIAAALKCARERALAGGLVAEDMGVRLAIYDVADSLGRDNRAFDRDRFLKACGVNI